MIKTCMNCKYSNKWTGPTRITGLECRRYPPIIVRPETDYDYERVDFPTVEKDSWCGEWVEKEKLK